MGCHGSQVKIMGDLGNMGSRTARWQEKENNGNSHDYNGKK